MFRCIIIQNLTGTLAILCILGVSSSQAQSVCSGAPLLGENGPELCVHIEETPTGASMDFRAPADANDPPLVIAETVGAYFVDLTVEYVLISNGISILIDGTATRTSPGTGGIIVVADGGWGTPVPGSTGRLNLTGFSTGTSLTQLGGGAGYPAGTTPAEDVAYTGYTVLVEGPTNGSGVFNTQETGIPILSGAVAVHIAVTFHINVVGEMIHIPARNSVGSTRRAQNVIPFGEMWDGIPWDVPPSREPYITPNASAEFAFDVVNTNADPGTMRCELYTFGVEKSLSAMCDISGEQVCTEGGSGWECEGDNVPQGDRCTITATFTNLPVGEEINDTIVIRWDGLRDAEVPFALFRLMPENSPPVIFNPLADLEIVRGDTSAINLNEFFLDPDGNPLTYSASSSDSSVVNVVVTESILTLVPAHEGTASVVVLADDFLGGVASDRFNVTVLMRNTPPEVVSLIPTLSLVANGADFTVNLNTVFSDADGDLLSFTATSSDPAVAEATISNGNLTVKALAKGTATVTVTANDGRGGTAEAAVQVNVPTGVHSDELGNVIPTEFDLFQNYPNPFNPMTTIRFDVPETSRVNLSVYDMLGRQVASLVDGVVSAGKHTATFDAHHLPNGSYIYSLETPEGTFTKTMILLK